QKRPQLADMFEQLARASVDTAMPLQGHEKTTLSMAATAAAIAVDKMRLLREESTSNQAIAVQFQFVDAGIGGAEDADVLASGRKFRVLSVVDEYSRECLSLEVDTSFRARE